jgi:hypothetical protein
MAAIGLRKVGVVLIMQSVDSRPPHTSLLGNSPGRMSRHQEKPLLLTQSNLYLISSNILCSHNIHDYQLLALFH